MSLKQMKRQVDRNSEEEEEELVESEEPPKKRQKGTNATSKSADVSLVDSKNKNEDISRAILEIKEDQPFDNDIVAKLAVCMKNTSLPSSVLQHVMKLLVSVCQDARQSQLLFTQPHNIHEKVVDIMSQQVENAIVQEQGCFVLGSLAQYNPSVLVARLAYHAILSAMRTHSQHAGVQETGCRALTNLAVDDNNKRLLVLEPHLAHEAILSAMRTHIQNADIQDQGCCALANLANLLIDDDNLSMLGELHLVHEVMLNSMRTHPQNAGVQEQGCCALATLAYDDDNSRLLIREPYLAHQTILTAMRAHIQNAGVQTQGCLALGNLTDADCDQLLIDCHVHFAILAALQSHPRDEKVQAAGVWILCNLSYDVSNCAILRRADVLPLCEKAQRAFPNNQELTETLESLRTNLE